MGDLNAIKAELLQNKASLATIQLAGKYVCGMPLAQYRFCFTALATHLNRQICNRGGMHVAVVKGPGSVDVPPECDREGRDGMGEEESLGSASTACVLCVV